MRFIADVIGTMITTVIIAFVVIGIVVVACIPEPCEHETIKIFYFTDKDSFGSSSFRRFCPKCHTYFSSGNFRGTPNDPSYLEAIKAHSDGEEFIGGKYYTISATVNHHYDNSYRTRIQCEVRGEGVMVKFYAEFREEFNDAVALLDTGDEITFRGRFYDTGCGFTDCELIDNSKD